MNRSWKDEDETPARIIAWDLRFLQLDADVEKTLMERAKRGRPGG